MFKYVCMSVSYTHLDVYKRQVCWSLVFYNCIIVCDCGICFCILCIFDVECFEYCVMFCIDLYLFWYQFVLCFMFYKG